MRNGLWLLLIPITSWGAPLSLPKILESVEKNFPLVIKARQDVLAAEGKSQMTQGAFDLNFNAKQDNRFDGYYDGIASEFMLEKPLQVMNSRVYSGYRISEGEFPLYEGKYDTLSRGETSIGVAFSLLRYRAIDKNRLKLWNALLDVEQAKNKETLVQLKVKRDAIQSFWTWVIMGKTLQIRRNLLKIAEDRTSGLEQRSRKGDLARIYLTENEQYILKRRAEVLEAEQDFIKASNKLRVFYPTGDLAETLIPNDLEAISKLNDNQITKIADQIKQTNPQFLMLDNEIEKQQNLATLGENINLPKLDFNIEANEDRGLGNDKLREREIRGMIKFSYNLEQNEGDGQLQAASSKVRALKQQRTYLEMTVDNSLRNLIVEINTAFNVFNNTAREVEMATLVEKAEKKKFAQGASDFFVINLREMNTVAAKVKQFKAFLKYQFAFSEYQFLTLALKE